ncbi:MAG: hypothetical protein GY828_08345 [Candidatus Gracilibacteria bacterium]|nr:hypothetical protein [Candidatus Gracilibacteria bacterium]
MNFDNLIKPLLLEVVWENIIDLIKSEKNFVVLNSLKTQDKNKIFFEHAKIGDELIYRLPGKYLNMYEKGKIFSYVFVDAHICLIYNLKTEMYSMELSMNFSKDPNKYTIIFDIHDLEATGHHFQEELQLFFHKIKNS